MERLAGVAVSMHVVVLGCLTCWLLDTILVWCLENGIQIPSWKLHLYFLLLSYNLAFACPE